jgi:glycosyltransferase involved in cell wall biosynthesis
MAAPLSGGMSFLILAYHYPPSGAIGARRPAQFVKYLSRMGYRVEVLTASRQDQPAAGVTYVPDPADPLRKGSLAGMTHMLLRKFFFPFEDSVVWSWNLYRAAEKIIRESPEDWVVLSTFPPISTHLAALRLRKRYPIRWAADFRDPLAHAPSRGFALQESPFLVRRLSPATDERIERSIAHRADLMIANTDIVADHWRHRYPRQASKITHIWNGFDPEQRLQAEPIPPRPYRLMAHVGNLYHGRHPGLILESLERLLASGRLRPGSFRLKLLGAIEQGGIIDPHILVRLTGVGCVEVAPWTDSRHEAQKVSAQADYLLLVDWEEGQQVPAKIFEYICIGRPILALTAKDSPSARILKNSGIPHLILAPDTPLAVADEEFLKFLQLPSDPAPPSRWFDEQFNAERRVATLVRLLTVQP